MPVFIIGPKSPKSLNGQKGGFMQAESWPILLRNVRLNKDGTSDQYGQMAGAKWLFSERHRSLCPYWSIVVENRPD